MSLRRQRERIHVCIDIVSLFWIFLDFILFVYLSTYVDLDLTIAVKGLIGIGMLIGGLALAAPQALGVGMVADFGLSMGELFRGLWATFLSMIMILLVNQVVAPHSTLGLQGIQFGAAIFSQIIGTSEEVAVRGYILNLVENATGSSLVAITMSSLFGATWHAAIYGARDPAVLVTVFASFAVIGFTYATNTEVLYRGGRAVRCRRLSPQMNAHSLVNTMTFFRGGR